MSSSNPNQIQLLASTCWDNFLGMKHDQGNLAEYFTPFHARILEMFTFHNYTEIWLTQI